MMVIGHKESIIDVQEKVENIFSIKTETNLTDYLGCEFHMNKNKTKGWLGQPTIVKSSEKKFSEEAMKHRLCLTPGTPRFIVMRVADEEDKLPTKEHAIYRSGVGTRWVKMWPCNSTKKHYLCDVRFVFYTMLWVLLVREKEVALLLSGKEESFLIQMNTITHVLILRGILWIPEMIHHQQPRQLILLC